MGTMRILDSGEQALVVEFGSVIDADINVRVHRLAGLLTIAMQERILELVPTYRSLMVYFDPLVIGRKALEEEIAKLWPDIERSTSTGEKRKVTTIPVSYGGEFGPDLEFVAHHNGLTEDEVVAVHTSTPLLIHMLGFTPGFPYLAVSKRIASPRLDVPRLKVPAGSVGIAGAQSGIYPIESPGGWRLIGRTPLRIFDRCAGWPFLLAPGDFLQFASVGPNEFHAIRQQVELGSYVPQERTLNPGVDRVQDP